MIRPLAFVVLALTASGLGAPSLAQPKAGAKADAPAPVDTVRFSYEKWSRAGDARYVLVPQPASIKAGSFEERTKALFKALEGAKKNTYGSTRLAFKDDAEATGIVYVWLDAGKQAYHPIVMAETTYTFTENGASKVIFPKVNDGGWTRSDVPFPAYVLTVPLWQALPPTPVTGANVVLPDGSMVAARAAIEGLSKKDPALLGALWHYLEKGPPAATLAAVKAAGALKIAGREEKLLPVLQSADAQLRGAALEGLADFDDATVNAAVRKVMDGDPDAALRDRAAGILSKSKDPAFATAAQYHALRSADAKVVAAAATALGESKQKEATEQLVAALAHTEAEVRAAAIASLLKRGDTAALIAVLGDAKAKAETKIEVAKALTESKDKAVVAAGLQYLAVNGKGDDSAGAAAALAGHDGPATYEALGAAVKHAEPATRRAAASALSRLGSTKGLALLSAGDVEDADSGAALLTAIRTIYAAQDLDSVLRATRKADNAVLRRSAVATLGAMVQTKEGKRNRKKIVETLQKLAQSDEAAIRAAAARSFGDMPGDDVKADVLKLAGDSAVEVQRDAAHALRAFPGDESVKLLLGFAQQKDAALIANAVESLGVLKAREALDPIISKLNHDDVRVRRAATGALVQLGETLEKRKPLLSFFSERLFDKDPEVKLKALEGLKLVKDPRTVTAMAALLQDPSAEVRQATLLAMAATGDASAIEAIAAGLEDDDKRVRRTAIDALKGLQKKAAVKVLKPYAQAEKDKELADHARQAIQALGG
ncbi:MAG: HEAT repeat domain-containing protein [Myxococcales bacterium]|nr:HEAT repeat domain-containing protein [Myxococcales bacterium]